MYVSNVYSNYNVKDVFCIKCILNGKRKILLVKKENYFGLISIKIMYTGM